MKLLTMQSFFTNRLPKALRGRWPLTLLAFSMAGCAGPTPIEAVAVLQHGQCQSVDAGVTRVDYADLARIRGSNLLSLSKPDGEETTDLLLVAISRGQQPTPGYALSLDAAFAEGTTALIRVLWDSPPSDAVLAQVITHPCLVVGLPSASFSKVRVVDQDHDELGRLTLP
jgi:hypothetical protein